VTALAERLTPFGTQLVGEKNIWVSSSSRNAITVEAAESPNRPSLFGSGLRALAEWRLMSGWARPEGQGTTVVFHNWPDERAEMDVPEEMDLTVSLSAPLFEAAIGTGRFRDFLQGRLLVSPPVTAELSTDLLLEVPVVLQKARTKAGLPVQDLAAMFGIKRRQFYNLVSGEDQPDKDREERISRVANAIGQISDLVNGNSRKVRAALLARISSDSLYNAAVADNESRLNAALGRALAAIRDEVSIRQQLPPSNRATPSEAAAVRAFRRAAQDEMGTSSGS
jgi:transcriptional regulator with XRE-family HTH domain